MHLKSVLWLATTVALPPHDVIGCRVSSRVDCLGGVQRAANLARFNADARLHVQATIQRIWLLLVVNGGTFELVPLGIGSAGDNLSTFAVSGQNNRARSRNLLVFFHLKAYFMLGPLFEGPRV